MMNWIFTILLYMKKLIFVSDVIGNKSVIKNNKNGYICNTVEEYVSGIKNAIKKFPEELPENAYKDVIDIYNTDVMKKKYIMFYHKLKGYEDFESKNFDCNSDI